MWQVGREYNGVPSMEILGMALPGAMSSSEAMNLVERHAADLHVNTAHGLGPALSLLPPSFPPLSPLTVHGLSRFPTGSNICGRQQ